MSEPVVETPANLPMLRREAILPRERRGGLGAVALLCSLAGVASGFALATTILATQIAESEARMARRAAFAHQPVWGTYLGVVYDEHEKVLEVLPDSPAADAGLRVGDTLLRYDAVTITYWGQLGDLIRQSPVGHEATLDVQRADHVVTVRPTLIWHQVQR